MVLSAHLCRASSRDPVLLQRKPPRGLQARGRCSETASRTTFWGSVSFKDVSKPSACLCSAPPHPCFQRYLIPPILSLGGRSAMVYASRSFSAFHQWLLTQLSWIHQDIYQWFLCFPFQFLNFTALTSLPLSWSAYALKMNTGFSTKMEFQEWVDLCVCIQSTFCTFAKSWPHYKVVIRCNE